VFAGAVIDTTPVAGEVADAEPAEFFAVTVARTVCPTSLDVSTYVEAAAPEIAEQLFPFESQRCQAYVYEIGVTPTHVPVDALSVCPGTAEPDTAGATVLAGLLVTTAVAEDDCCADPPAFVAVTTTRSVWPMSALTTACVVVVAPAIAAQLAPPPSQRFHWYAYVIVPLPVHVPLAAVSVALRVAGPEIVGSAVFAGGLTVGMGAVTTESAVADPAEFVAVTSTRSVWPTSSMLTT